VAGQAVLLVGGTGFLGAHTARAMQAAGHRVSVLSRGTRDAPEGTDHLRADRRDPAALAAALEGRRFDFTVDFAALDAVDIERLLLVPYAALGRYVMISSGQVYLVTERGRGPCLEEESEAALVPEPAAGSDDHREWLYGMGKRRAESALLALRASHGVRAVVLRLPIVQGEADVSLRLWAYIERLLDGGSILLPDGGRWPTRHLYARDLAAALVRLLEGRTPREAVYNLAQPDIVPLRDLLERIARTLEVKPRFVDVARAEIERAGIPRAFSPYSGPWSSLLDPGRAGEWGFAGTRLDDYLPRVVRWHLEHRPPASHPGYATRPLERRLAATLAPSAP